MIFLVLAQFPDGLVPAETFIDGEVFPHAAAAIDVAQRFVQNEKATLAKVYCVSICDETGKRECNPYCSVFPK